MIRRLLMVLSLVAAAAAAPAAAPVATAAVRTSVHVDFGARGTVGPTGYVVDYGLPFTAKSGYGWERAAGGKALSLLGNGGTGPAPTGLDRRYASFVRMQSPRGPVTTTGQWQTVLHNGVYDVTVAVGDGRTGSLDRVTAQPATPSRVVLVGGFAPTRTHPYFTVTKRVRVTDGRLTLSPAGGKHTTIDFVVATAVPVTVVDDFTVGGTVGADCRVTGFDGVLANSAGTQCDARRIAFVPGGLALTSTPGQLADDDQQNALYESFDGSGGSFTITARVVGPLDQLTADYQQVGAFFGPDQDNFVKVEAEHNGAGPPHLTMFARQDGVAGVVGTVPLPALVSADTLDVILRSTAGKVTAFYRIAGAAPVQLGDVRSPPSAWFSGAAKAGIEVSNSGSPTALTATFSRFVVATG